MCGGALILGRLLGAPVARLGRLAPGEADPAAYMPGWRKEWGYLPVDVVAPDPLFAGLGPRPVLRQAHGRRLAAVPPGCALLASSPACRVQAFRRTGTLIYGVQFHPEAFTDAFPAGRRLLTNFFALALASGERRSRFSRSPRPRPVPKRPSCAPYPTRRGANRGRGPAGAIRPCRSHAASASRPTGSRQPAPITSDVTAGSFHRGDTIIGQ